VTGVLQAEGFIDTQWFTEEGADNGTRRHLMCYLDDIDDLDESSIDPIDIPYLEAWRQLKIDTGIEIIESEVRRYNHTYRYCGKPDTIVIFQEKKEVWDRKASTAKQSWHRFQGGGYTGLYEDVFFARCVYLMPNGKFKLSKDTFGRKDRIDFLTILRTHQLREEMKK
jgi:hypothetical protein